MPLPGRARRLSVKLGMLIVCVLTVSAAGVVHRRLYPELSAADEAAKDDTVRPFTEEQLRSLYYNYELEHMDEFVEPFLRVGLIQ